MNLDVPRGIVFWYSKVHLFAAPEREPHQSKKRMCLPIQSTKLGFDSLTTNPEFSSSIFKLAKKIFEVAPGSFPREFWFTPAPTAVYRDIRRWRSFSFQDEASRPNYSPQKRFEFWKFIFIVESCFGSGTPYSCREMVSKTS